MNETEQGDLTMDLVLLGFINSGRSEAQGRLSLGWGETLPEDASTVAILLEDSVQGAETVNRLRVQLNKALERGIRLVLCLGPQVAQVNGLLPWLLTKVRSRLSPGGPWEIRSAVPELARYYQDFLAHALVDRDNPEDGLQILAEGVNNVGDSVGAVSARFQVGKTIVVAIPVGRREEAEVDVLRFLELLPTGPEYPTYLDALPIGDELTIRDRIRALAEEIEGLEDRLEAAHRVKRVLFFTDLDLEHEVVRFLNEELGTGARHMPGNDEDFRLVSESGADWCIGEVKGPGRGNVTRSDVGALMFHRQKAGLAEGFPGLLVVNSFHRIQDVKERDQAVPADVADLAKDNKILTVRTLDLVRLYVVGDPAKNRLLDAVQQGGWLEANPAGEIRLH